MHSDSFGGRPGFRDIPDPLGRLNQGRFVRERDPPDPFGRLMADPGDGEVDLYAASLSNRRSDG